MKQRMRNLLDETVNYYSANPDRRAVNDAGSCMYYTPDGKMCAVGRLMEEPQKFQTTYWSVQDLADRDSNKQFLKSEYRDIPLEFLNDLQDLHDEPNNWDETGLTHEGLGAVQCISKEIEQGTYCHE